MTQLAALTYAPDVRDGQATAALDRMAGAADRLGAAVTETDARLTRGNASFDAIGRRYNEVERAAAAVERATRLHTRAIEDATRAAQAEGVSQERLQATIASITRAREAAAQRAVLGYREEAAAAALARAGHEQLAASHARFAGANDNAATSTGRLGQAIGQAGFQIQDFAGQVAAGQSALVALSQQGSQLLGIFGTAGAVAGAALTVGVLAAQFLGLASNTDTLAERLDALDESYQGTERAASRYRDSLAEEAKRVAELTAYYASLSDAVLAYERRRLTGDANRLLAERGQRVDEITAPLRGAISGERGDTAAVDALGNALGTIADGARELSPAMDAARRAIEEFYAQTVPTRESIAALGNRLDELKGTAGPAGEAIRAVLASLGANEGALLRTADGMERLRAQMLAAGVPVQEVDRLLGATTLSADGLTAALARLRNAANNPLGDMGRQLSNVNEELQALRQRGLAAANEVVARQRADSAAGAAMDRAEGFVRQNSQLGGEQLAEAIATARREAEALSRAISDGERDRDKLRESMEKGARATRGAAEAQREMNDELRTFGILRRDAGSGLLLGSEADARAMREIQEQMRGAITERRRVREEERRDAEAAAREVERNNRSTTDSIVRYGADRFADLFSENKRGWAGMLDTFRSTFRSLMARLAAEAIIRPIVAPVVSSLGLGGLGTSSGGLGLPSIFGGTPQAAGTAAQGGGTLEQAGMLSSFSSLSRGVSGLSTGLGSFFPGGQAVNTGFGFVDGALNTTLFSTPVSAGESAFRAAAGLSASPGVTVGQVLGPAAAIGGGLYGIYSGIERGGVGGYTSAAGGAVSAATGGAMLASAAGLLPALGALGPAGLIAGAVLAIAGSLLPGEKPSSAAQGVQINTETGVETYDGNRRNFSQANLDEARRFATSIANLETTLEQRLGFGTSVSIGAGVDSARRGDPANIFLNVGNRRAEFSRDEDGARKMADQAAAWILEEFKAQADRMGLTSDQASILRNSASAEALGQNLEWYEQTYKALTNTAQATSAFAAALEQLRKPYDDAIAKAGELALATDALTAKRDEEIARATRARDMDLRQFDIGLMQRLGANDNNALVGLAMDQAALAAEREMEATRQQLQAWGLSADQVASRMENLRRAQELEASTREATVRRQIEQQQEIAAAQIGGARSVLAWLNGQALGATSTLTGAARVDEAAQQFRAAAGGTSLEALTRSADAYLAASRSAFGGATAANVNIVQQVRQTVAEFGQRQGGDSASMAELAALLRELLAERRAGNLMATVGLAA